MVTKKVVEETAPESTDPGDDVSVHINYKRGLPNYSSIEFGAGVTISRRDGETDGAAWERAWEVVERELDSAVDRANEVLTKSD